MTSDKEERSTPELEIQSHPLTSIVVESQSEPTSVVVESQSDPVNHEISSVTSNVQQTPWPTENLDQEAEWVKVYGFTTGNTNFVLGILEQYCGPILKHFPGNQNSNWMHVLFQVRSDAEKALNLNGKVIGNNIVIGVQPVIPTTRDELNRAFETQKYVLFQQPKSTPPNSTTTPGQPAVPIASPIIYKSRKCFHFMYGC
ncbi:hypothetical protein ACFE04_003768 [Oxalis oulophora]